MKTTILLTFLIIFISRDLFGQNFKQDYIDSDIRKQFFPITTPDRSRIRKPDLYSPQKFGCPGLMDLDRFGLYKDYSFFKDKKDRLYSDIIVNEDFPENSRYKKSQFIRIPDSKGVLLITKPDTSKYIKYHLIIDDLTCHSISK